MPTDPTAVTLTGTRRHRLWSAVGVVIAIGLVCGLAVWLWLPVDHSSGASSALSGARDGKVRVAVAANFAGPLRTLVSRFEQDSPYSVEVITGSTGLLYAQITQGAPFDVFLAADQARPMALEKAGLTVGDSRFTYAKGQLVLWQPNGIQPQDARSEGTQSGSPRATTDTRPATRLRTQAVGRVALANPRLAPYGAAADNWLRDQGLLQALQSKLVFGDSVAQVATMVTTGNAEFGFVSLAQVVGLANPGPFWPLAIEPLEDSRALNQDAVLLTGAAHNPAAVAFLAFLRAPATQLEIERLGYAVNVITAR